MPVLRIQILFLNRKNSEEKLNHELKRIISGLSSSINII